MKKEDGYDIKQIMIEADMSSVESAWGLSYVIVLQHEFEKRRPAIMQSNHDPFRSINAMYREMDEVEQELKSMNINKMVVEIADVAIYAISLSLRLGITDRVLSFFPERKIFDQRQYGNTYVHEQLRSAKREVSNITALLGNELPQEEQYSESIVRLFNCCYQMAGGLGFNTMQFNDIMRDKVLRNMKRFPEEFFTQETSSRVGHIASKVLNREITFDQIPEGLFHEVIGLLTGYFFSCSLK